MSFLDEFDLLDTPKKTALLRLWLQSKTKELFAELRERRPIFPSPIGTFVTKHRDVIEVLDQHQVFTVIPYSLKMQRATGHFILGEDETSLYRRDVSALRLVFRHEDLTTVKSIVARCTKELLRATVGSTGGSNRIDIVSDLTRLVPARLVAEYFGVPGPNESTMLRWSRTIFRDIFLNLADDPAVRDVAMQSSSEMRLYLDQLIATTSEQLTTDDDPPNHILGRLLRLRFDGESVLDALTIRHNLLGLIVGAIDTTSKATAQLLDTLLDRPDQFQEAQRAAENDDNELLSRYVFEALRFHPQSPFVFRLCKSPYTIAKGTNRETIIQPDTMVFPSTLSAMFDSEVVDSPDEFLIDRPEYHYLHFGHGLHTCFGKYINLVQIPEIAKHVLRLRNLRRASGDDGRLKYEGPFPQSMVVEFDSID